MKAQRVTKNLFILLVVLLLLGGAGGDIRAVQAEIVADPVMPPGDAAPAETSWGSSDDSELPDYAWERDISEEDYLERRLEAEQQSLEELSGMEALEDVGIMAPVPGPFTSCAFVDVPDYECDALVALYTATGGASWTDSTNWLANDQVCTWYGISCSGWNVSSINLQNNNLVGPGNGNFSGFTELVTFNISYNDVSGNIGGMIDTIFPTGLINLSMEWNAFWGDIDADIANLTSLQELRLCGNSLTGDLTTIFTFFPTSLTRINLCYNDFSGTIPPAVASLTNLDFLNLGSNLMAGDIEPVIGYLPTGLYNIQLYDNGFYGTIPAGISAFTNLQLLDLGWNTTLSGNLTTIIGNLPTSLMYLYLSGNGFEGTIPASISGFPNLTSFYVSNNLLAGDLGTIIGNLPVSLNHFGASMNNFTGTIPAGISSLTNLTGLEIQENDLTGDLGTIIGNLPVSIRNLYLGENGFTGTIPSSISALVNLDFFSVRYNPLSGPIPTSITSIPLTVFNFQGTYLCEPDIPAYISWKASVWFYYQGFCLGPFNGSAVITASNLIAAIGRPHNGSEIMAYNGVSTGAPVNYLPMLFKNTWGSYDASFTVENASGIPVTFSIYFKDALSGATTCEITGESLPGGGVRTYEMSALPACNGGTYIPDGWFGGAIISSTQPMVVVATPKINGTDAVSYNAFTGGSPEVYLPMLFRGIWGYESAFYVQNLDPAQDANISISFYDNAGVFTCDYMDPDPIGPSESRGYWMSNITNDPATGCTGGTGFAGTGWAGSAVITTGLIGSSNIVALGRPHMGSEVAAYNGFTTGSTTNNLPMLFRGQWGYDAAIYIQNVSTGLVDIEIYFYDTDGIYTCMFDDPIPLPANATRGYWLPYMDCNVDGVFPGTGWAGSARIITTGNTIAVGRPHLSDGEVVVYNSFPFGSYVSYVPRLFLDHGADQSALYIQNLDCLQTTATIQFFDEDTGNYCTMSKTIEGYASAAIWLAALDGTVCAP